ncbi:unnamed protein product [Ectocarpus sp. 13 AM-2016]
MRTWISEGKARSCTSYKYLLIRCLIFRQPGWLPLCRRRCWGGIAPFSWRGHVLQFVLDAWRLFSCRLLLRFVADFLRAAWL